ncbi:MAG TPA: HEAT repeat domain-containing protein [Candidatus Acidoferrum sp.]|nr:HEAT repeat domain-containing protein [Candidatus Acidoferrum sp.]
MIVGQILLAVLTACGLTQPYVQQSDEAIAADFQQLQSDSPVEIHRAAERLLQLGRSDESVREYLARRLPPLIERGPAKKENPGPWIALVQLAGDLKIAESSAALAKWLTIDNIGDISTAGFLKLENNPAGTALVKIGDPAVPALYDVLEHGTLRERRYAVYALIRIASPRARSSLLEHQKNESDEELKKLIQRSLSE